MNERTTSPPNQKGWYWGTRTSWRWASEQDKYVDGSAEPVVFYFDGAGHVEIYDDPEDFKAGDFRYFAEPILTPAPPLGE